MFGDGKTQKEIGEILDIPRRTIGKLCKKMGLSRSRSDSASLVLKSDLDDPEMIKKIVLLRSDHSLSEIADELSSSISAVHRICDKYDISLPDNFNELQSKRMLKSWTDEKRMVASVKSKELVTDELRKQLSESSKQLWKDEKYRSNQEKIQHTIWGCDIKRGKMSDALVAIWSDQKLRDRMSKIQKEIWSDPERREKISQIQKEIWKDPDCQLRMAASRASHPIVSSIQTQLYEILDDLGIPYFREYEDEPNDPKTIIGPYNFDCVIPRSGKPDLLVECQGDYWHSLDRAIVKDNQKKSYINNNFPEYELKYLWEHEFKCKDKVYELIKYWMDMVEVELVEFSFDDIQIIKIDVKTANKLLDKYHYLSGCGRGGILFGAFVGGELVAVCAFSTLLRGNMPYDKDKTRELSRFCIHPRYQKKNFGSWMVTRCIKLLPKKISVIVSYCDTTFNHDGALYKACNFRLDGEVRPDYWYVNEDKWVMHKKTLYNHACKMSMKEREFADRNGYKRVYGDKKLRFIFRK